MAVWVPTVPPRIDGQDVAAATDNQSINALSQRTDWLKAQLEAIEAGKQLILRAQSVEAGLVAGQVVYIDQATNTFKAALADIDDTNLNLADATSFWQGVILTVSGTVADIVIGGSLELTTGAWAPVFDGGVFASGNVYLSAVNSGQLTTDPGTTGIYIGYMRSTGELLVRLGTPGSFIDHVHLQRTLQGDPAGAVTDPAFGGVQSVTTPDSNEQGWLPATPTYFPGFVVGAQIPTGAKFGYNIQHPSEGDLRAVFPVLPASNAQFEQAGLIVDQTTVITNNFGIWWMDDTYGNAPWPVDYTAAGETSPDIRLWTTRIIASATVIDLVTAAILSELTDGGIDDIAVASIKPGDATYLSVTATEGDALAGYHGDVVLSNTGAQAVRARRGVNVTGSLGNASLGWRGVLDIGLDIELPAEHIYTELIGGGDKVELLTTNGVNSGTPISARGHRLGSNAGDFIDYQVNVGNDLESGVDYQVTAQIRACVDTAPAATTTGNIDVEFYQLPAGAAVSSTSLEAITQAQFVMGTPGDVQMVAVGPLGSVVVNAGDIMIIRLKNNTGGSPLASDTLRVMSLIFGLTKVP